MRFRRDSREWALIALTVAFWMALLWKVVEIRGGYDDGWSVSLEAPKASLLLTRDGWRGDAGFPPCEARRDGAVLELFSQSDVRPSFGAAPERLLRAVPGIGASLAAAIIGFREAKGRRITPRELLSIPGIGEGRLRSLEQAFAFGPQDHAPEPIRLDL